MQPEAVHAEKLMKELGMMDIWRDLQPGEKVFTFFPLPFNVFSVGLFFYAELQ